MNLHALLRITFLLLMAYSSAYSQENLPDVKPLSPNAAALFKVLERPEGTFTGTVPVQFPLCSINSGNLSTSLNLSYNGTGGIRVEEAASSVGLGFSLNDGGGRIVQTVRGQGDDWSVGFLNNPTTADNFNCLDMNGDAYEAYYGSYNLDLEPDIFMYNFNGQSGKFFFLKNRTIVMMQKTGIKITYTTDINGFVQWTITDEKGNIYTFGNRQWCDYTYDDESSPMPSYGASSASWYLTSVKDMTQENQLNFTYQGSGELFTTLTGGRLILGPTNGCNLFDLAMHNGVVQTETSDNIVSKITARSGFILISASTGRSDSYGRKVDSIRLFTPDSQLVKKYTFTYGYFSGGSYMWEKRLYLKEFSEFGNSGTDSLTHKFEYHTEYTLPSRLSTNTDSWGYYNGYGNGSWYFPNYVFINGSTQYRRTDFAKKNAREQYAKAGMLKKIKYPTGGYREFIYEGNTALVPFNPNLYHPDETNSITRTFNHTESEWNSNYGFTFPFFTKYFQVNSNDGGTDFRMSMTVPYNCSTQIKIYKTTTANQSTGGVLVLNLMSGTNINNGYTFANGYYRMELYRDIGCWVSGFFATWSECTLSLGTVQTPHSPTASFNENDKKVGGLRVKEIRDYDPVSNKINKTEYKYKIYSGDSTHTSGLLILQPKYIAAQTPSGVECFVNAVLAQSNYPLAGEGGSHVVYPEVRTIESGNGWTDRIFSFSPDQPPVTGFPYTPPVSNNNSRGKLLQEKIYDSSGVLLNKTSTSYTSAGWQIGQAGLRVKCYWAPSIAIGCGHWSEFPCEVDGMSPQKAVCNSFYLKGYASDIYERIDTSYTPAGSIAQKTRFTYDTLMNGRMFLTKKIVFLNNGQTKITTYRYPFSQLAQFVFGLTSAEQATKTALLNNNYLQPLEIVDSSYTSAGVGSFISGTKYIFSNSGSDYYLSKARMYTTRDDSSDIFFSGYDSKWNITEKYAANNVKEVYLWGYDYTYPVAKVVGSDYATVLSKVNNSVLQNPSNDAALRTELNNIRTGLAGSVAQVYTYTYKKGVGMSSETDPAGKTTLYEYDAHGRLNIIRDQNNNVLKKIEYDLANPQ